MWEILLNNADWECSRLWLCGRSWRFEIHRNWPNVENTHERRWLGRTDIILWPCLFGLYSQRMWNNQGYCRQLKNHVWIQNFRRSNWKKLPCSENLCIQEHVRIQNLCWSCRKAILFRETWHEHFLMVLWHGRSCKEKRGKVLRTGEQNNSTVIQRRNSMHGRPPIQGRRNGISWRIVHSLLTKCSEIFYNSFVSVDLIFCGPWTNLLVRTQSGLQSLWQTPESIDFLHSSR